MSAASPDNPVNSPLLASIKAGAWRCPAMSSSRMNIRPFIKILLGAAFVGVLAAIAIPNFVKARTSRSLNSCVDRNLPALAEAKQRWTQATARAPGEIPEQADLLPYLEGGRWPECPMGGTYRIGPAGSKPECSFITEHAWTPQAE